MLTLRWSWRCAAIVLLLMEGMQALLRDERRDGGAAAVRRERSIARFDICWPDIGTGMRIARISIRATLR
jgi:hypothetical protein